MKFTVIRSRFLDLLSNVQSVVPGKPSLQIVANALIEAREDGTLSLTATDLDVTVCANLAADVKVDEPGRTTLPVRRLVELLRTAPEGEIQFDIDADNVARVITPAAKYRLIGLDAQAFPTIKEPDETAHCFTIDRAVFREMLRKTAYAAGKDETRRVLTGVLLQFADGKLTMVATDGRRLALVEQELDFPPESACDLLLPAKARGELARLLNGEGPMRIYGQKGQIVFDCGTFRLYSKLIDGVFAKYQAVIPTACDERVSVNREELIASIQRVDIMSNEKANSVRLAFAEGALSLSSSNAEIGDASDVLPIKYAGRPISAAYNPDFLLDCLRNLDTDEVTFELTEGHAPSVIKCNGIPFLYVIMPMRLATV